MGDVFSQVVLEENNVNTLLTQEICNLSYPEFLTLIGELNILRIIEVCSTIYFSAKKCLESKDYQLVFAVKKDTDSTLFWKASVQIACVKVDSQTQKVLGFRLLTLSEFLKVFKTFKCQVSAAEQSKSKHIDTINDMSFSSLLGDSTDSEPSNECIICFERKQDVTLPCAHSFCTKCIEEWNESHDTCPICRERLESPNDAWVISEVPKAEEISDEIRENLLELTDDKPSTSGCNPS